MVVVICRKQLCGPGDTIQSYNHQAYHKPQQIQKLSNNHHSSHEDDIDVGKAGDEVIKLEGKMMIRSVDNRLSLHQSFNGLMFKVSSQTLYWVFAEPENFIKLSRTC